MAKQSTEEEVFNFSNTELTREDLINTLNEMVHENKKLSQTFEEVKAENMDLKNSSVEPCTVQLGETDSLKIELSKLKNENESLRLRSFELESENQMLNLVMSSWTQSSVSLSKLQETQNPLNDKSGLGFNTGESNSRETYTQSNLDDNLDGAENEIARKMASFTAPKQLLQEPLKYGEDDDMSGFKQPSKIIESAEAEETNIEPVDTEELSLAKDVATMTESEDTGSIPADMMLPSVTAAEITRIKLERSIEILEVHEGDWYKASLPRIGTADKETDSLETDVRRREFTIAKYREMLLRKFLESHRQHFQAGQPSTATDLQIIALLSSDHIFAVETLQTQMRIHGLKWERICSSRLFEGDPRERGAVIARSNTSTRSLCWLQTKTMVDGSWVIQEANDLCQRLPKRPVSLEIELSPQMQFDDTLDPVSEFLKVLHKQWADVCIEVLQSSTVDSLQTVGSHNFCRDIVAPMVGAVVRFIETGWTWGWLSQRGSDQGWPDQGDQGARSRVVVRGGDGGWRDRFRVLSWAGRFGRTGWFGWIGSVHRVSSQKLNLKEDHRL
ncbi:splicing factor 3B subunit 1-like [Dorcoceras hygrometricum]|uniref:Splicing factor 3B subunit 1-like n=1 Tax=Dorcoceras hygrometricum TaxID=472368 RepID=A0A2Z7CP49_9LAMI|nr:splicing factor 3B subunit 1-like [Dorcoceras hygrometricum]